MSNPSIKFGSRKVEADVRMLYDMKKVVYDKSWLRTADDIPLYYMYRDLYLDEHKDVIRENNIRFDITMIPPKTLGKEYVKTKGHYHNNAYKNLSYPELYGVIQGEAHYLLQKVENGRVKDVVVVKAESGDKVLIPPNYGHITINPGQGALKMANWISTENQSSYGDITEKEGGAYYETEEGFVQNKNYDGEFGLRFANPLMFPDFDMTPGKSIYKLIEEPSYLRFLNHPEKYQWLFEKSL